MTQIYLVRHAEAEGNLYRRIHGQYDSLITDLGHKQVEKLAERFKDIHIDAVYSSDLTRTRQTAAGIYGPKGLGLQTVKGLREIHMGCWEDRTWGDMEREDPDMLHKFNFDPDAWVVEGAESFEQLRRRVLASIRDLAAKHEGQSIAVVTHGSALRTLFAAASGMFLGDMKNLPYCDNTGVSLIEVEKGEISLKFINDNSHVSGTVSTLERQHWWKMKNGRDGTNLRYIPMDLERRGDVFLDAYRETWQIAHGNLDGFSDVYLKYAKKEAAKDPMTVVEASQGDTPVGIMQLSPWQDAKENVGSIAFYYMREEARGKNLSVQPLGQAVSYYRGLGRKALRLRVAEENARARAFYEKYGFKFVCYERGAVGKLLVMDKDISMPFDFKV